MRPWHQPAGGRRPGPSLPARGRALRAPGSPAPGREPPAARGVAVRDGRGGAAQAGWGSRLRPRFSRGRSARAQPRAACGQVGESGHRGRAVPREAVMASPRPFRAPAASALGRRSPAALQACPSPPARSAEKPAAPTARRDPRGPGPPGGALSRGVALGPRRGPRAARAWLSPGDPPRPAR